MREGYGTIINDTPPCYGVDRTTLLIHAADDFCQQVSVDALDSVADVYSSALRMVHRVVAACERRAVDIHNKPMSILG